MTNTEVQEFITRYFSAALEGEDITSFTDLYTEDGVLEDPVGTPPLRGRAAIGEFLAMGRAAIARARPTVHEVITCGDESAVRWSVEVETVRGQTLSYSGVGIFVFAGPGQLRHVREFYDASQLAKLFAPERSD